MVIRGVIGSNVMVLMKMRKAGFQGRRGARRRILFIDTTTTSSSSSSDHAPSGIPSSGMGGRSTSWFSRSCLAVVTRFPDGSFQRVFRVHRGRESWVRGSG